MSSRELTRAHASSQGHPLLLLSGSIASEARHRQRQVLLGKGAAHVGAQRGELGHVYVAIARGVVAREEELVDAARL